MIRFFSSLSILLLLLVTSCKSKAPTIEKNDKTDPMIEQPSPSRRMSNFQFLKTCMNGSFNSKEQSLNDTTYFDIRLRMVPIWKMTDNVFYLYVEQSMSTALDKPYRQRVYKVVKGDETHFTSYIYTLPEPEKFIGKKEGDIVFTTIDQEEIVEKVGCEVVLIYDPLKYSFFGSTGDKTCSSDRSGAKWASSIVSIMEDKMVSWDQGWNEEGKQVWGAEKGGYIFIKEN